MENKFTPTQLQNKPAIVFNSVQAGDLVVIEHKSRPDMVVMLKSERDRMLLHIYELQSVAMTDKPEGDSHLQADLLKG